MAETLGSVLEETTNSPPVPFRRIPLFESKVIKGVVTLSNWSLPPPSNTKCPGVGVEGGVPKLSSNPIEMVPESIVVAPINVLLARRFKTPTPIFFSAPSPASTADKVAVSPVPFEKIRVVPAALVKVPPVSVIPEAKSMSKVKLSEIELVPNVRLVFAKLLSKTIC